MIPYQTVVISVNGFNAQAIYGQQLRETALWNSNEYLREFNIQPAIDALSLKRGKPPTAAEIAGKITEAYRIQFGPDFLKDSAAEAGLEGAVKLGIYVVTFIVATALLSGCVDSDATATTHYDDGKIAPGNTVQPTPTIKAPDNVNTVDDISGIASDAVSEPFNENVVYKQIFSYPRGNRWEGVVSSIGIGYDEDDFYAQIVVAPGHETRELNVKRNGLFYLDIGYNSKDRNARDNKELSFATNGTSKVRTRLKRTLDGRIEKELTKEEVFNSYKSDMHVSGNLVHVRIHGLRKELKNAPSPYITDGETLILLRKLLGFE